MSELDDIGVTVTHWSDGHDGPGWYWFCTDYPEEGSAGAFDSEQAAIGHAMGVAGNMITSSPSQPHPSASTSVAPASVAASAEHIASDERSVSS